MTTRIKNEHKWGLKNLFILCVVFFLILHKKLKEDTLFNYSKNCHTISYNTSKTTIVEN